MTFVFENKEKLLDKKRVLFFLIFIALQNFVFKDMSNDYNIKAVFRCFSIVCVIKSMFIRPRSFVFVFLKSLGCVLFRISCIYKPYIKSNIYIDLLNIYHKF
jgi:hypothetical protein